MTENLLRGVHALLATIRLLSGVLLVGSVSLNFVNVVGRYFFNVSIPWAEEAMLFLMVGCVFLGNGLVAWSGRQIRMDVIVGMMPPRVREALDLLAELVFIATAITIVIFAWPVIRDLAVRPAQPGRRFSARHSATMVPIGFDHGVPGRRASSPATGGRSAGSGVRTDTSGAPRKASSDVGGIRLFRSPVDPSGLGLPIFLVLLVTCVVAVLFVADVPTEAVQTYMFGSLDNFPLLAVRFRAGRHYGARRHRAGWSCGSCR
jgi:TRAP-type C4-dicarboxylate transport system permease small subunit